MLYVSCQIFICVFICQDRFTGVAFHSKTLFTDLGEGDLADPLAAVAAAHPKVRIVLLKRTSAVQLPQCAVTKLGRKST